MLTTNRGFRGGIIFSIAREVGASGLVVAISGDMCEVFTVSSESYAEVMLTSGKGEGGGKAAVEDMTLPF